MDDKGPQAAPQPLPSRALNALEGQLKECEEFLRPLLTATVAAAEESLFKRANHARNNAEQELFLAGLDIIKHHRDELPQRFLTCLAARIEQFGHAPIKPATERAPMGLELLAEQSQDQSLILADLASRTEARATIQLFELGHRYAVLASSPILEAERQPFSPGALCDCLRQSIEDLKLAPEQQAELFRAFELHVLRDATSLYDRLNTRLIECGILPNLRSFAPRRQAGGRSGRPDPVSPSDDELEADMAFAEDTGSTDPEHPSAPRHPAPPHASTADEIDEREIFATLSALLERRRQQMGLVRPEGKSQQPRQEDIHAVLGELQRAPSTITTADGQLQPRSMQYLRRDLLAQLRRTSPYGLAPRFSTEQRDTIELMTMLFDRLSEDIRSNAGSYLLSELQAPLLRVALEDSSFFTNRLHPARHWLDKVAEASAKWGSDHGEDDGDPALIERIHGMNRTINRDFDGDPSIFEGLSADLQKQLDQLAHKAKVTERRYVEASRGRERLEVARERARQLVGERITTATVPSLTRNLLQHAWTDVLALSLLRQGEDGEDFRKNLHIADVLGTGIPDSIEADTESLCTDIEHGLSQVGMEPREASLLAREATGLQSDDPAAASDDQLTRTELAMKLKQRTPVGTEHIDKLIEEPVSEQDQAYTDAVAQIKTMAFGTWFEFDVPGREDPVLRKMAWYSTQTGRCLFVNRRGVRTHDTTIDQLAQAMVAGSARLPEPDKGSFIDRAWTSIVAQLKKLTGANTEEQPA